MDILQTDKWLLKLFYGEKAELLDTEGLNVYFEENGF